MLDINSTIRSFNRAAETYDGADVLQREVADRLLDHLDFMLIKPKMILNCGARTGYLTQRLKKRYPDAEIVGLDFSEKLLGIHSGFRGQNICSYYETLPFQKRTFDIIISNCALHWSNDLPKCFNEFQRVLKPESLLLFTMLGKDTLRELRQAFGEHAAQHVHAFYDMHDVGDQLVQSGLQEPVMNMETITMEYESLKTLFKDLKATGTHNANQKRLKTLMGKHRWQSMLTAYEDFNHGGAYPASFEIIYGHAWQAAQATVNRQNDAGETLIPVDAIEIRQ